MARSFARRLADAWKFANTDIGPGWMKILHELYAHQSSKSGAVVNWRTALEATTALACARVIAEGIAQVPYKLMVTDGANRLPATDKKLYYLLHDSPNEWMTSFEFREMMGLHLVFCGNFFAFITRYREEVVELLPFEPQQVTVKRDGWALSYEVQMEDGKKQDVPAANMWHVRGPSWNGWMGLEGVKLAREAIGLALATEEHGSLLFKNGAQGSGLLSTEIPLTAEKAAILRESWQATQAGSNRFKTAVLWNGMKWTPMSSPNDETQFLETRKFQVEEICRAFRVMPIMVGYSDKTATYASAEQMFIAHVVHTLSPWGQRIEQSANKQLLTDKEREAGYYTKFMFNGLMRGAAKDRVEFYKGMYGIGSFNPNEIRELEDMNPYDGGEKYRVPLNMADPNAEPEPDTELQEQEIEQ